MEAGIAQNYDRKTMSKVIGSAVLTLGLGAVPVGMKRYVTLVRANNISGANNTLFICSAANSANTSTVALASAAQKYAIQLEAGESDEFPRSQPDVKNPLFSIAAGAYINAKTNYGSCRVFMQYYDM